MRLVDETPLDPEVVAALDAIDATLAGEPVAPEYADLAELALLLRAERPVPALDFAQRIDEHVARRFVPEAAAGAGRGRAARRRWLWTPALGLAAAMAVAIVIVVGGGSTPGSSSGSASSSASLPGRAGASAFAPTGRPTVHSAASSAASPSSHASARKAAPANALSQSTPAPFAPSGGTPSGVPVQPVPNGRKLIRGAQLSLSTNPGRIDAVAQEVFVAVGQVHGIVSSSTVTATGGPGGYAQFQLRIPSGSMSQAMAALSALRYAHVASRTDSTQDVNDQYQADVAKVSDDRAVRASLLRQLANAVTQGEIDSLTIRLHDIDAAISRDRATLQSLNNQINYSSVTVTINGGVVPIPAHTTGKGGFGLHQAVHDAGRVLTVAAGVVLIAIAALAPIALLAALGWWIAAQLRRRRREQALDTI